MIPLNSNFGPLILPGQNVLLIKIKFTFKLDGYKEYENKKNRYLYKHQEDNW